MQIIEHEFYEALKTNKSNTRLFQIRRFPAKLHHPMRIISITDDVYLHDAILVALLYFMKYEDDRDKKKLKELYENVKKMRTEVDSVFFTLNVPDDVHRAWKVLSYLHGVSMEYYLLGCLLEYVKKHKKELEEIVNLATV